MKSIYPLHDASWFAIVTPMSFGMPIFDPVSILTMTAVLIIVFIESMGMFLHWVRSLVANSLPVTLFVGYA